MARTAMVPVSAPAGTGQVFELGRAVRARTVLRGGRKSIWSRDTAPARVTELESWTARTASPLVSVNITARAPPLAWIQVRPGTIEGRSRTEITPATHGLRVREIHPVGSLSGAKEFSVGRKASQHRKIGITVESLVERLTGRQGMPQMFHRLFRGSSGDRRPGSAKPGLRLDVSGQPAEGSSCQSGVAATHPQRRQIPLDRDGIVEHRQGLKPRRPWPNRSWLRGPRAPEARRAWPVPRGGRPAWCRPTR